MKKFLRIFLAITISFIGLFCLTVAIVFLTPPEIEFDAKKLIITGDFANFYDERNNLISISDGKNFVDDNTAISDQIKKAFISIEDKNFYSHKGIDYKRIIKASLVNLKNLSFKQGASTISQQLIKNTHLSNEKTIQRKITEIKLTKILEKNFSKDEIITAYLNTIYFGENRFGIYNASKKYFNKTPSALTLSETALLAGIISAPSRLNPCVNLEGALKKRNQVLNAMYKQNFITFEELQSALNEKIIISKEQLDYSTPYLKATIKEAEELSLSPYLLKDCKIYTYYDDNLQHKLSEYDFSSDYQAIILNNENVGISAYFSTCGEIEREIASLSKPLFVYAPAIEENYVNEYTKIVDEKTNFNGYSPKNYGNKYYGEVTVKEALSKSLNIPAVKILDSIGIKTAKKYAKKFNLEIKNDGLSVALGNFGNGVKIKDLASYYSTFANYGEYKKAGFIKKIVNPKGKVIYKNPNVFTTVYSTSTASTITDILKECAKSGTAKKLSYLSFDVAVKTGTNGDENGNIDCYSTAYTVNHTVAVWLGNKDNSYLAETGGNTPTKLVGEFLVHLYSKNLPPKFEMRGLKKVFIDKISYDNDGEILLSDDNSPEKYKKEVYLKDDAYPKSSRFTATNYEVIVDFSENILTFNLDLPDYLTAEIYEEFQGKQQLIYTGKETFNRELLKEGVYDYYVIFTLHGVKDIKTPAFKLKTIKYSKNFLNNYDDSDKIPKDWWKD